MKATPEKDGARLPVVVRGGWGLNVRSVPLSREARQKDRTIGDGRAGRAAIIYFPLFISRGAVWIFILSFILSYFYYFLFIFIFFGGEVVLKINGCNFTRSLSWFYY